MSTTTPRATKIVATLGPASSLPDILRRMIAAGVDVVRLNFSHGSAADHERVAATVRAAAQALGREVAIMADLQGPKIRIGRFADNRVELHPGADFVLDAGFDGPGDMQRVGLDYKELARDVRAGDLLLLDDGLIVLEVADVRGDAIHTRVRVGGPLSNNKGINRQGGGLSAAALTPKDMRDIRTAVALEADYIAVSFPKNAADMMHARALAQAAADEHGMPCPQLIAKIERAEAVPALAEIIEASDGLMVARGDLAVEVGNAAVPALQKRIIRMARAANKLTITATQMMESMIHNQVPTRAEVSDVANAVIDGTDAVMLSAETATGRHPVAVVEAMAAIAAAAEASDSMQRARDFAQIAFHRVDQAIAYGALFTARQLGCKAIVALTDSGMTPLWISRHDSGIPIYALSPRGSTRRRLAMFRNVHPCTMAPLADRESTLQAAGQLLQARGFVAPGDRVVITVGAPMGAPGSTNSLQIFTVGQTGLAVETL